MTDSKKSNQQQSSVETLGLSGHDSDNIASKKTSKAISKRGHRTINPNDIAIKVSNVSKTFKLPHEKHSSIKGALVGVFNSNRSYEKQRVLKDISFEIKKGEFFGIVGRNGSGKSTLLKLLAGIYSPDEGKIQINGKLTPFIELGVGFNPELTGRENVFLNGALLGFSRKEMAEMYDEIVEFAELEKFMDQKLKNYSSGMQVRLAFSIAIRADTDILVLDEVLAVGDANFQKKCFDYFQKIKNSKKTVILVTHDMNSVKELCDKAIIINEGDGSNVMSAEKAALKYDQLNFSEPSKIKNDEKVRWGTKKVTIKGIEIDNKEKIVTEERFKLNIVTQSQSSSKLEIVIGLAFIDKFGINISGPNSIGNKVYAGQKVEFTVDKLPLNPGEYRVTAVVFDKDVQEEYDHIENAVNFSVSSSKVLHGKISMLSEWRVK